jgi:DNA helicase-2/ATP-dependent DNA helicase PcrA
MNEALQNALTRLNPKQQEAVARTEGPLLVLAGAGSGKTAVLVTRLALILEKGLARPWETLALTFTNKAAGEMKARLLGLLGPETNEVWAGTFHSVCARILRRHDGGLPPYTQHFAIYDADDSRRLMKEIMKRRGVDEKYLPVKHILSSISRAKDSLVEPARFTREFGEETRERIIADCYKAYQDALAAANAMDFDDILFFAVRLLQTNAAVRESYQRRFKYIMADEYQDTNHAQFKLIELLSAGWCNLCVVGDDDQSIYRFRGATIENILDFERIFPAAHVVRLEQNYRSTQNILGAANTIIAHNENRKGKTLWTANDAGTPVSWQTADDERAEANLLADRISRRVQEGGTWSGHAILYRNNALSAVIEQTFVRRGVPYRIIGGHRFYDRKEIRDALAYLTVIVNPGDDLRLRRILNEPKRKIGDATIEKIAVAAAERGITMYEAIRLARTIPCLNTAAARLCAFAALMESFRTAAAEGLPLHLLLAQLMERSGYDAALALDPESCEERRQNLNELGSNLLRYQEEADEPTLAGFLEEVALLTDIDQYNQETDAVVLMTIHAAKGLEFPHLFLPAWEENVFPSYRVLFGGAPDDLEEERRLAYVAVTRACESVCFTTVRARLLYGQTGYNRPSQFLYEAGLREPEPQQPRILPAPPPRGGLPPSEQPVLRPGDQVKHRVFGTGCVLTVADAGGDQILEIVFEKGGTKKIMANYARLEKL